MITRMVIQRHWYMCNSVDVEVELCVCVGLISCSVSCV